jgi:hypothetical protein
MVARFFDLDNVKQFVGNERLTEAGDKENQAVWAKVRQSLLFNFPDLKLPQNWEIDLETWGKFRRLAPDTISNSELRNILIKQGYIGLTPQTIQSNWGEALTIPKGGYGWTHIRVIFYRGIFGDWQAQDDGTPFVRVRIPSPEIKQGGAKYLSPKGSGSGHIFWPYALGKYAGNCEPCKVFGSSHDGDDLPYAPRGKWLLTEGEDKAMLANLHGYPCIGIGGVEMWRSKKSGPLHPWLFAFALNVDKLTILYDSDAFQKPAVVDAQRRLCREFFNHLVELAKISDTDGDAAGYCEQVWGATDAEKLDERYGAAISSVKLAYAYLPPNPYAKGLDDVLAVSEGRWLNDILTEAPAAFDIQIEEADGDKKNGGGNTVKARWMFTEPQKLGLLNGKLAPEHLNSILLSRAALSAGWLQLNYWRPVGQRQSAMIYCWDKTSNVWNLAPVKNAASFSLTQWSKLAPSRSTLDGIGPKVEAELSHFSHLTPNIGLDDHRYMGVADGDFDITAGYLKPISPDHHCFSRIDIKPFEGKPSKLIDFYARRMMGGEADMERFLSYLAICFRAPGKVHALGWITGKAKTGKSTLMKLVSRVLEGWIASEDLKNVLDADNANRGYLPLHLLGKSLIYDDDWKGGLSTRMISRLNVLATNGEMAFRSMGKDPILCKPNMGALIISNQELVMGAADVEGLPRRFQKWEFKDVLFTDADFQLAQSIVEEEKGNLLWYLLHKDLEDCAKELQDFTASQQADIERDFAVNHSADWIDAMQVWVEENLKAVPVGQYKAISNHKVVSINIAGSSLAVGPMAKDLDGSSEGGPSFNYLPETLGLRHAEDGTLEIFATSANWIRAISNYEREEHNPHATQRGDRTTLKTLKTYIDNIDGISLNHKAEARFNGDRIKGWAIAFKPTTP